MLMLAFAALLTNALIEVPPSRWTAVALPVKQHDTTLEGTFQVLRGSRVQVIIADREQAVRFHKGRSFKPLFSTGYQNEGRIRLVVREAGDYVLLIDNRIEGRQSTQVRLSLEIASRINTVAGELPPGRRIAVVSLSLLFFGSALVFSAYQFLRSTRL